MRTFILKMFVTNVPMQTRLNAILKALDLVENTHLKTFQEETTGEFSLFLTNFESFEKFSCPALVRCTGTNFKSLFDRYLFYSIAFPFTICSKTTGSRLNILLSKCLQYMYVIVHQAEYSY